VTGHVHDVGVKFNELLEEHVLPFEQANDETE
jgi:hypothetical protein